MIDLVLPEDRITFATPLLEMHRDRKSVFVDRLGWDLPSRGSWLEIDRFDDEFAVYLLARSPEDGRHLASLRLLPTTRPHLLNSVFLNLCEEGAPTGECIWEISRLLTTPHVRTGQSALKLHRLLALALAEFASLNDVSAFTLVIEASRLPALLSIGWTIIPLGLPTIVKGQELVALSIDASPASLASLRARLQLAGPALRARALMRSAA